MFKASDISAAVAVMPPSMSTCECGGVSLVRDAMRSVGWPPGVSNHVAWGAYLAARRCKLCPLHSMAVAALLSIAHSWAVN